MSHSSPFQTQTPVHSIKDMMRQRHRAYAQDQCILSAMGLYAQLVMGTAFYLYEHVSTPGYLSILLCLPLLLLMAFLSLRLSRRTKGGAIFSLAGKIPGKALALILAAVFFLDAQLAAYAISAILSDVLPNLSPLLTMMAVALIMGASIGGEDEYALPRLSRLVRWPLLIAVIFCAVTALPHGNTAYLSPVLGRGAGSIFQGTLWMTGCLSGACCPLLLPHTAQTLSPLREKGALLYRPLIIAGALAIGYAAISSCMLPFYSLARPENLGFKLLLFTKVSGYAPAWSLLIFAHLFLMLIALSAGVLRSAALITWTAGKKKSSPALIIVLLLLLVPAAALKSMDVEKLLIALSPFRGAAVLIILTVLWILSLIRGKPSEWKEETPS